MKMSNVTSIGRPLDFSYPTNTAIAVLAALAWIGFFLYRFLGGQPAGASVLWGLGGGAALFLTWAQGRELDPAHQGSAFVGVALAVPGIILLGMPGLLVLAWFLGFSRIINRTVGKTPTVLDAAVLAGVSVALVVLDHWLFGFAAAAAFLLDAALPPANGKSAFLAAAVTVVSAALLGAGVAGSSNTNYTVASGVAVAAVSLLFLSSRLSSGAERRRPRRTRPACRWRRCASEAPRRWCWSTLYSCSP